ncbi:MAG: hypothetical protein KF690_10115 [Bacteroidetes bacterium]|nr:hypothetical protein [Bacteroidota bacterium]
MSNNKAEAFQLETEVLEKAKAVLASGATPEQIKAEFANLTEQYEKLLDEAKFLTKISDKLEAKLNASNEKLQEYNKELAHEAESAKVQTEKVLKKNKKLFEEKTESESSKNKLQMTMTILIGMLFIVILLFFYQFYGCKLGIRSGPECEEIQTRKPTEEHPEENAAPATQEAPAAETPAEETPATE